MVIQDVVQGCRTRLSYKAVIEGCHTRLSYKTGDTTHSLISPQLLFAYEQKLVGRSIHTYVLGYMYKLVHGNCVYPRVNWQISTCGYDVCFNTSLPSPTG